MSQYNCSSWFLLVLHLHPTLSLSFIVMISIQMHQNMKHRRKYVLFFYLTREKMQQFNRVREIDL